MPRAAGKSNLTQPAGVDEALLRIEGLKEPRVSRLLRRNRDLASLVGDTADQLAKFIPDSHLRLELLPDPEYGDEEQLFLGVYTSLQDDEALEALRRFDQEWWVHHAGRAQGLLYIDLNEE